MDVVTRYLYGSLDAHIYMKILDEFKIPDIKENENRNIYSIKLQRSLYGLKQSGRMWYNHIAPKLFYPHELKKNNVIIIKKV